MNELEIVYELLDRIRKRIKPKCLVTIGTTSTFTHPNMIIKIDSLDDYHMTHELMKMEIIALEYPESLINYICDRFNSNWKRHQELNPD